MTFIRHATNADLDAILDLCELKRLEYQNYQPVFWRKAPDSRQRQLPFLQAQLSRENVIALVHEREGSVDGFIIAVIVPTPPVYAAGGPTCSVDDYWVHNKADWETVGPALLDAASEEARKRGACQVVVVCSHNDGPKRGMLAGQAYSIASEWWVRPLNQ